MDSPFYADNHSSGSSRVRPRGNRGAHHGRAGGNRDRGNDYPARNNYRREGGRPLRPVQERREAELARGRNDNDLGGMKLRISALYGKNDPDAFLEWEKKVDIVFNCQDLSERKKINLAASEFNGYAIDWWDQIVTCRHRNGEQPVETWDEMATLMRQRFIPSHYHRDLHTKLRRLTQGTKSVEDYHQEIERLMLKADDRMELQEYNDMAEMLHKAVLVEQQIKRKGTSRYTPVTSSRPTYRDDKAAYPSRSNNQPRTDTRPNQNIGKTEVNSSRTRDIECFKCRGKGHYANKCPNQRAMLMLDTGEIVSDHEEETEPVYDEEETEERAVSGELLVAWRVLIAQERIKEEDQRENLFHTQCLVQGKVCSLIIDGGSCTNVASTSMVDKLGLETRKHPHRYNLRWLNNQRQLKVTKQVTVPISIGRYEDEVVCDVLPMEVGHLLLGRPWQFDKKAIHDGFSNKHTFEHQGRKIVLAPLSPHEVYLDQVKLEQNSKGKNFLSDPQNTLHQKRESEKNLEMACEGNPVSKESFLVRPSEVKYALATKQSFVLLIFKDALASHTNPEPVLPSKISHVMQEFADVFPEDDPGGLPPI
ncbi:uncharacterized protein LOC112088457 [Eutrema salsugineum]|uniref:uncharacterized protein LOC112088457 n=1 Tax=Eutrema salsugineum TaxID=72664 RepID=UPI000CECE7AC|nr:uncharacterized protein LOC112088457 [Eutrema salsugineum]